MRRISTATKVTDKFGAGKHGFTNGNAVSGIPATDLEDVWFDHVQEEIAAILEAAGIAVDGSARNQLLTALRSAGVFQTPTTGDRSTKVATTQMFANEFSSSLALNGYDKLPNGRIMQWGYANNVAANTSVTLSLPITFPNNALITMVSVSSLTATAGASAPGAGFPNNSQITLWNNWSSPASLRYIAIGN